MRLVEVINEKLDEIKKELPTSRKAVAATKLALILDIIAAHDFPLGAQRAIAEKLNGMPNELDRRDMSALASNTKKTLSRLLEGEHPSESAVYGTV